MAKCIQRYDLNVSQLEGLIKNKKESQESITSSLKLLIKELSSKGYEVMESNFIDSNPFHKIIIPRSIYIGFEDALESRKIVDIVHDITKKTGFLYRLKDTASRK